MNVPLSSLPDWSELRADPADSLLTELTLRLQKLDGPAELDGGWPSELWANLVAAGAGRWALPNGSDARSDRLRVLGRYARVAEGSLTSAFILSQHDAAMRRLSGAIENPVARWWLDAVTSGLAFTTVGISHLTTSNRAGASALRATVVEDGYLLNGVMPWVTAAEHADVIVSGASLEDGQQLMIALPVDREGVTVQPSFRLAALQASCTAEVRCEEVKVVARDLLVEPGRDVVSQPGATGTGGLETSALALGQARAAITALHEAGLKRSDLAEPLETLTADWLRAWNSLASTANAEPDAMTSGQVRVLANTLVLRATQAWLAARKGSGFLLEDDAQRWARQALFFLVWSCPSPVAQATVRDLLGGCEP